MCGEKLVEQIGDKVIVGSPPHVRGKACERFFNVLLLRITPACAGKRRVRRLTAAGYEDHPRMCGEKTKYFRLKSMF